MIQPIFSLQHAFGGTDTAEDAFLYFCLTVRLSRQKAVSDSPRLGKVEAKSSGGMGKQKYLHSTRPPPSDPLACPKVNVHTQTPVIQIKLDE